MPHSIVTSLHKNLISGHREEPVPSTGPPVHACVICTEEVSTDLQQLLPTVGWYTDLTIHLVCDAATAKIARQLAQKLDMVDRVHCLPWLNKQTLDEANKRLSAIKHQNDYWKPGPIWWKLEGTRRVLEMLNGQSCMLLDSDIVFCNEFRGQSFQHADAIFSPFFWPDPDLNVPPMPGDPDRVHISQRDGVLNAGYAWITKPDVMALWLELYEAGIGGFYEQYIMGYIGQKFCTDWFNVQHNFGQWRNQTPPPNTISLHIHATTKHFKPSALAVQERATLSALQCTRWIRERSLGC